MDYDVIITAQNTATSAFLPSCLAALAAAEGDASRLHLYCINTSSGEDTTTSLSSLQAQYTAFGNFQFLQNANIAGFAAAANFAAHVGASPFLLFLDADAAVAPGFFPALDKAIDAAPESTAAFECRTLPYEATHHIDPVTLETTLASTSALAVRRTAFNKICGFDPHFSSFGADIDFSWRLRAAGYLIQYVPDAEITLLSQQNAAPEHTLSSYTNTLLGTLYLRCKFGSLRDIFRGHIAFLSALRHPAHFAGVRKALAKNYLIHFVKFWPFWLWRFSHHAAHKTKPGRFEGGFAPDRGQIRLDKPTGKPLLSVVVRTCGRPESLRQTLTSLCHQTYPHFEVIVVEDGPATSEELLRQAFSFLPLRYVSTGEKLGRAKAGNLGLSMAKGDYCNFLDDDDYFYPDHLEHMAAAACAHPKADLITASSMAMQADVLSSSPYCLAIKDIHPMLFDRIDNFMLCQQCLMPIQSVLFKRSLYQQHGGLNEALEGDEDWSMWLKYFSVAQRIKEDTVDIPRATSLFLVPADPEKEKARVAAYRRYEQQMLNDPSIQFIATPRQMRRYYEGVLADMRHLQKLGKLKEYLNNH